MRQTVLSRWLSHGKRMTRSMTLAMTWRFRLEVGGGDGAMNFMWALRMTDAAHCRAIHAIFLPDQTCCSTLFNWLGVNDNWNQLESVGISWNQVDTYNIINHKYDNIFINHKYDNILYINQWILYFYMSVFLDLLAHPGIFFGCVSAHPLSASADSIRTDGRSHGAMVKGACHPNGPMLRLQKSWEILSRWNWISVYIIIYIYTVYIIISSRY